MSEEQTQQPQVYEYTYQPPFLSFIKHKMNTSPVVLQEALLYSIAVGFLVYILLQLLSTTSILYALLTIVFFYLLLSSNNGTVKDFFKKLKYVARNSTN